MQKLTVWCHYIYIYFQLYDGGTLYLRFWTIYFQLPISEIGNSERRTSRLTGEEIKTIQLWWIAVAMTCPRLLRRKYNRVARSISKLRMTPRSTRQRAASQLYSDKQQTIPPPLEMKILIAYRVRSRFPVKKWRVKQYLSAVYC